MKGSALRRKIVEAEDASEDGPSSTGAGNAKLSSLIPRFLRLSALVAAELGREAREEEESSNFESPSYEGDTRTPQPVRNWEHDQGRPDQGELSALPSPASIETARAVAQAQYNNALRPSQEWYLLLAGLLTRAVLEGYLTAGWRSSQPAECLLKVGLGIAETSEDGREEEAIFDDCSPDELPSLMDAAKVLFPSLRNPASHRTPTEAEFEAEMESRLRRVRRLLSLLSRNPDPHTFSFMIYQHRPQTCQHTWRILPGSFLRSQLNDQPSGFARRSRTGEANLSWKQ